MAKACAFECKVKRLGAALESFVLLAIRLWMGEIFVRSGYNKLMDYLSGNGENVTLLFSDIHPVPLLPAELAAPMATAGELMLGLMLVLGLMTRSAALGLVFMTFLIQIALPLINIHALWALCFLTILVYGSGKFSIDALLSERCGAKDTSGD
ncbi:MAG: DoxX family protein [Rickettsiales bacterium]|nr:DoxX family protein [Rickettsiales bacterium]